MMSVGVKPWAVKPPVYSSVQGVKSRLYKSEATGLHLCASLFLLKGYQMFPYPSVSSGHIPVGFCRGMSVLIFENGEWIVLIKRILTTQNAFKLQVQHIHTLAAGYTMQDVNQLIRRKLLFTHTCWHSHREQFGVRCIDIDQLNQIANPRISGWPLYLLSHSCPIVCALERNSHETIRKLHFVSLFMLSARCDITEMGRRGII